MLHTIAYLSFRENESKEFRKFQYLRAGYEKILWYSESFHGFPRHFYFEPPMDIHPLSEDPPEDPIQEIFTRNLGIFATGIFFFDRIRRMIG